MRPHAVITGASSGIGAEIARQLVADGHDVTLVARSEKALEALASDLEEQGAKAAVVVQDLAQPGAAEAVASAVGERPVDLLVNSAGVGTFGPFATIPVADQLQLVRLNIEALTHLTALFLPAMIERGSGGILQVGSTAGFQPGPLMATYYASKAYVLSFTEALAEELSGTGVTVSVLCPGPVATGFQATAKMENSKLLELGLTPVDVVAREGRRAISNRKTVAIVGFKNRMLTFLSTRFAPRWLTPKIVKRIQAAR